MPNFAINEIKDFDTKQKVYKLLREGRCYFDEFVAQIRIDTNLVNELGDLYAIIEYIANGTQPPPPKQKFKKINIGNKARLSIYEAKSRHLRLYLFHETGTGQILIMGGKKTEQTGDIERIKKIAKDYCTFKLKTKK